ncbi:hypothetical protein PG988_000850 [Apiospora saccharicola]
MENVKDEKLARFERRQEIENYFDNAIEAGWVKSLLVPRMRNPANIAIEKSVVDDTIEYVLDIYVAKNSRIGDEPLQRAVDAVKGLFLGPYGLVALKEGIETACDDTNYPHPYKEQTQPALLSQETPGYDQTLAQFENFNRFFMLLVKDCRKDGITLPVPMLPAFKAMDAVLKKEGLPSYEKLKVALGWANSPDLVDAMKHEKDGKDKCRDIKQSMDKTMNYWRRRLKLLEMATTALREEKD